MADQRVERRSTPLGMPRISLSLSLFLFPSLSLPVSLFGRDASISVAFQSPLRLCRLLKSLCSTALFVRNLSELFPAFDVFCENISSTKGKRKERRKRGGRKIELLYHYLSNIKEDFKWTNLMLSAYFFLNNYIYDILTMEKKIIIKTLYKLHFAMLQISRI